jgi:L-alanine-DL-glutamate epimerase-like enolase superfamily enzyme
LVEEALAARERGFTGSKIKIGRPQVSGDYRRLAAARAALVPDYEIMTDANQGFTLDERGMNPGQQPEGLKPLRQPNRQSPPQHPRARGQMEKSSNTTQ